MLAWENVIWTTAPWFKTVTFKRNSSDFENIHTYLHLQTLLCFELHGHNAKVFHVRQDTSGSLFEDSVDLNDMENVRGRSWNNSSEFIKVFILADSEPQSKAMALYMCVCDYTTSIGKALKLTVCSDPLWFSLPQWNRTSWSSYSWSLGKGPPLTTDGSTENPRYDGKTTRKQKILR